MSKIPKSNLAKSHDAMLAFLETLIANSEKFNSRDPHVQEYYERAKKIVAKALEVRGQP